MPRLASKELCTGCTACMSVCPKHCIEMKKDADGFAYPEITCQSECIKCGCCEQVCPTLKEGAKKDVLPLAYAAFSRDETLRMESSSGGIFTELAKKIINQNGVVFGARYNEKFEVEHCCIENESELWELRGAKYSESDLRNTFVEILGRLKQKQKILFSGTPCQVAGLKSFLRKEYDNLLCVDFVCHGVPSPMAWKEYVNYRAESDYNGNLPQYINLRSKETGWSRYKYSNEFLYPNGFKHVSNSAESLFMRLFVGDYISRESCDNCQFKGYTRISDITLGDFWGIWDIVPEMDDDKGTSVVLVHSQKGEKYLEQLAEKIKIKEVTLQQASRQNPSMLVSSKSQEKRKEVLEIIRNHKITDCEKILQQKQTLGTKIKGKIVRKLNEIIHSN